MEKMVVMRTDVVRREMCYFTGSKKYKIPVSCSFVSVLQEPHHDPEANIKFSC